MRSPEGVDFWVRGVYREVVEPERLVFTWAWEKREGHPGHKTLVTVNFAEHGAKTKMTIRQAVFPSVRERNSHWGGWSESFERLARYVAKA